MTIISCKIASCFLVLSLLIYTATCLPEMGQGVWSRQNRRRLATGVGTTSDQDARNKSDSLTAQSGFSCFVLGSHKSEKQLSSWLIRGRGGRKALSEPTARARFSWFKPGATKKEKLLACWLLLWNGIALVDALMFTFRPVRTKVLICDRVPLIIPLYSLIFVSRVTLQRQNLDNYLLGEWGSHALAQTRMLANCQLALIASVTLIAVTGNENTLKWGFKIMFLATLGAFRAVSAGVKEGTIKAPWKSEYTAFMSLPPLLLLSYFAFVY